MSKKAQSLIDTFSFANKSLSAQRQESMQQRHDRMKKYGHKIVHLIHPILQKKEKKDSPK